jgi:drug/metabolite transporter (DMT)-like permease
VEANNRDYLILGLGVVAVSTAAVLIREAAAPVLIIAAYRLLFASLPLVAVAGVRRQRLMPREGRQALLAIAAGAFLALHFGFWIASVKQTSIVTSVVLVTAQPLFVALASGPLLGERPPARVWLGIGLASFGGLVMISDDLGRGAGTLAGDLFALLGAVFAAAYILTGRQLRTSGNAWLPYVTVVYSTSALLLVLAAIVAGDIFGGYSGKTFVLLVLLALVPQLIGHTALNRSLGYLPAASVAVAILGEPIGATVLGVFVLGDTPTLLQAIGGGFVLSGVLAGALSRKPEAAVEM